MAQKRMFSLKVVDTDRFMDMPTSTQALYFHLGMHGDDDGFVSSPKKIARAAGCNDDDLRLLASKGYIIPFESGVIVIADWNVNNTLQNDRYHETLYQYEKSLLSEDQSGKYSLGTNLDTKCVQIGTNLEPERNLTKPNITEQRVMADKPPRSRFVPPSIEEVRAYCEKRGNKVDPQCFVDFYASKGWMVGKNKMKDWRSAVRTWERREGSGEEVSVVPRATYHTEIIDGQEVDVPDV